MFSERAHKSLGELRRRDWIGVPDFHDGAMGRVARARVQRAHRRRGTEGSNLAPSTGESRANLIPRGPVSNASCPRPVQLPNPAPLTRPYIKWFASDPAGMFDAPRSRV